MKVTFFDTFAPRRERVMRFYTPDGETHIVRACGGSLSVNARLKIEQLEAQGLEWEADWLGENIRLEYALTAELDAMETKNLEKQAS